MKTKRTLLSAILVILHAGVASIYAQDTAFSESTVGNTLQLAAAPPNCKTFSDCYWSLFGNGNITAGVNFLGTVAGELAPLEFRVNNTHAMRFEPSTGTPNIIGGFSGNAVSAGVIGATLGGGGQSGQANTIASDFATIGGGRGNVIASSARNSTIGGGTNNNVGSPYGCESCTISGGSYNAISGQYNSLGGGYSNRTHTGSFLGPASFGTIGGGTENAVSGLYCTVAGGQGNYIGGDAISSTIGGGQGNRAAGETANTTIGGGYSNQIDSFADSATINGGQGNRIAPFAVASTIGGGENNTILINGRLGTIPGGRDNEATRDAFAAGTRAKAVHRGAFVWGDSTDADIASASENSVTMRAGGGYRLFSDSAATVGVSLASGSGSWTMISDRNAKDNFQPISPREVLEKLTALPVQSWNYRSQGPAVRHIGPTAQDFKAAFDVGESDTGISAVDADGVALAAVQGLNQKLEEQLKAQDAEIRELRAALQRTVADLKIIHSELAGKKQERPCPQVTAE